MNNKAVNKTEYKQEKLVFNFHKDMLVKTKNVKNNDSYKDIFPDYFCAKKFFGINIPKQGQNNYDSVSDGYLYLSVGNSDFLEKIANTEKGCFNMKIQEENGFIVGFSELTAIAENYGIVIQSEFNLKKGDESSYFWTKLSFLKKQENSWKLDKVLAWDEGEEIKNTDSTGIIDSSQKMVLKIWSKGDSSSSENLFQKFYFKKDLKLWKNDIEWKSSLGFNETKFVYTDEKWYKFNTQSVNFVAVIVHNSKGKWSENLVNLCENSDSQYKEYCTKSKE